jgi:hypothetical protein
VGVCADDAMEYLGHLNPPSGVPADLNAYILNVHAPQGGYIDALALDVKTVDEPRNSSFNSPCDSEGTTISYPQQRHRRLDENPSCCGHRINHSVKRCNVEVIPFCWAEILSVHSSENSDSRCRSDIYFDLPNVSRQDGAPRYFDVNTSGMLYYPMASSKPSHWLDDVNDECGAILCATVDIENRSELFLDYGLQSPLPKWAASWYDDT